MRSAVLAVGLLGLMVAVPAGADEEPDGCVPTVRRRELTGVPARSGLALQLVAPASSLVRPFEVAAGELPDAYSPERMYILSRLATHLWADAQDVVAAVRRERLCGAECDQLLKVLASVRTWEPKDIKEVSPIDRRSPCCTTDPRARLDRGPITLELHCSRTEATDGCSAKIFRAGVRLGSYSAATGGGTGGFLHRELRLPCGVISLERGAGDRSDDVSSLSLSPIRPARDTPLAASTFHSKIHASSELQRPKGAYRAELAMDGRLATAWCEGADGPGQGQWIELEFPTPVTFTHFAIAPGYAKNLQTFVANPRITQMRVTNDSGRTITIQLEDRLPMLQEHDLGELGYGPHSRLRFEILDVEPGTRFEDACISELFLR